MREKPARGFTLVELLVMMGVLSVIALLTYPALLNTIRRARLEGSVRQTTSIVRAARLQAIKNGAPVGLRVNLAERRVFSFRDLDQDGAFTAATDTELVSYTLTRGLSFTGPPADPAPVDGFTTDGTGGWFVFGSDGAASEIGSIRVADAVNFLEIHVEPRATGRAELRKWDGAAWKGQGEGGVSWEFQ